VQALERAVDGHEAMVHLAAVPQETGEAEQIARTNVLGTFAALEAAARRQVNRCIFASSICAYGFFAPSQALRPAYLPIDEAHPCWPRDNYGTSKLIGETWCRAYADRHGMAVTCLRLATVWFPGSEDTARLLARLQGVQPEAGGMVRDALWQYVDARDAARAFRLALGRPRGFAVLNIGAGDVPFGVDPAGLARCLFGEVRRRGAFGGPFYAIGKADEVLGYEPRHTWKEHATHHA